MTKPNSFIQLATTLLRPKMGFRHLFAYGPLLDQDLIRERCPDPEFITLAHYEGRRFIVNSDGIATIIPRKDFKVYGVIWSVHEIGLAALDIHAGVPHDHERYGCFARSASGQLCVSEFYATRNRTEGLADRDYLRPIIAAARHWKLPAAYIKEMASWARPPSNKGKHARGAR